MDKKKRKIKDILGISGIAIVMAIFLIATIVVSASSVVYNAVSRFSVDKLEWDESSFAAKDGTVIYHSTKEESEKAANATSKALAEEIQAEGSVLLKNNGALPLDDEKLSVSVFGVSSVNLAYGGTGSGTGNRKNNVDIYSALEDVGFNVNQTLKNFYENKRNEGYSRGAGTDMNGNFSGKIGSRNYGYSLNEVERDKYESVKNSYQEFDDVALVVFSRVGGEGQDLPTSMIEFYENDDKHYLELTDEEIDLLKEVTSGGFEKVVVILNSLNVMELGFLFDESFQIDSALWIGGTGNYGANAVAKMLIGEESPSGKLSDVYAYDLMSSPSMSNYGDNHYLDNGVETTATYVSYNENIYIGYRYYETRYEDKVLNRFNAGDFDYEKQVLFPFGFGLSYTNFAWSDFEVERTNNGDFSVSVAVKNIGDYVGKDVVEIYIQKPYTEYDIQMGIEKSAVELVAYAKTKELKPNESQKVTVTFSRDSLNTYDTYGEKTYIIEAGEYFVTAASDSHNAINNILSNQNIDEIVGVGDKNFVEKFTENSLERRDVSQSGYKITNQFETESYSSLAKDMKLLTRSDWVGSFPTSYGDSGVAGKMTKEFEKDTKTQISSIGLDGHIGKNNDKIDYIYNKLTGETKEITIGKVTTSSGNGLNFIDMIDEDGNVVDYNDEKWQELVECMSEDDLYKLMSYGIGRTSQIKSINKDETITSDCPMGLYSGTLFPCYPIQASTWNRELATRLGDAVAEEALWNNVSGWYAPACNTHRTPFGGRNFEYYSEDGTLGGLYASDVVAAVQLRGIYVQIKHFALNDQDTNRGDKGTAKNKDSYNGVCTFANEQTIREIYLRTFQFAVEKGGAHGVMTSYNRIGTTWAGGHYGLLTEVLKNEWGMEGNALTDYAGTLGYSYMDMTQGLMAGNDIWLYPGNSFPIADRTSDAAIYYMQKAAKNLLFAEANSRAIDGRRYANGEVVTVATRIYTWQILLYATDVVIFAGGIFGISIIIRKKRRTK